MKQNENQMWWNEHWCSIKLLAGKPPEINIKSDGEPKLNINVEWREMSKMMIISECMLVGEGRWSCAEFEVARQKCIIINRVFI